MNLSDNLKKIRKDNNLSQEDLAEKLNVSRQSVSKWEQGIAYPEMDKVLQICKMFNLSIDELLNQNIKEVEKSKESKININKYLDNFLSYISKTVNMFSSMKFKDKLKCIFEQLLLILLFMALSAIIRGILVDILENILSFLPENVFYSILNIFKGIYVLIMCIVCVVLLLHIFKTRYLDYYVIVEKEIEEEKDETVEDVEEEKTDKKEKKKDNKKYINENRERIIIRDEKHSEYSFLRGILKVVVFFIKIIAFCIGLSFCSVFVALTICLISTFLIFNSGILFAGAFLGIFGLLTMCFLVLYIIYNFIVNKKCNLTFIFTIIVCSLLLCGVGAGLGVNSIKNFKIINDFDERYMYMQEVKFDMNKDTSFEVHDDIEYIEENRKDVRIVYEVPKYNKIIFKKDENNIYYYRDDREINIPEYVLNNLNEKVFVNPDYLNIKVYASKENIKLLKENTQKYYTNETIKQQQKRIEELEQYNIELEEELKGELLLFINFCIILSESILFKINLIAFTKIDIFIISIISSFFIVNNVKNFICVSIPY